ncbi:opioid-binding protein/cell adhesion molecule homolog [Venturia canescens]|uniref:opioid-binding protein/cell adhesion molecule homolog n=1 Tax=Venturia canescens TaxID=32260 RepID=UPI001C9D5700|nr:opioid-binding protein/cell adhesion molecule homolog [Venturia canescens]
MIGERDTTVCNGAGSVVRVVIVTLLLSSRISTLGAIVFGLFTVVGLARSDTPPSDDGPSFTVPISNVTVPVGREAILACVVEDLSNYKVAWLRVNTQTILTIANHVITKNHRIVVTHTDKRTWYLHIKDVKESDQGDYMCQINTDPMKSQVGYLQVVVPPDILDYPTSTDMVVREGSNVTFRCAATGSPAPNITWRREGAEKIPLGTGEGVASVNGSVFNITRVNRLHMGAYLCIASNGVPPTVSKRIALIVQFQPMIMIPNQLVGLQLGQNTTLECHSEAYPQSINYWTRENREIVPNGKRIIAENVNVDAYKIQMKLTLHNVILTDYGSYDCISNNSLGHTNGNIKLYQIIPPTTLPLPTTTTPLPTVIKVEKKQRSQQKSVPSVAPSSNEIIDASQSTFNQKDAELRSRSKNDGGHASASAIGKADRNSRNNNNNNKKNELLEETHRTDKTAQSMSSMSTSPISIVNTNVIASFVFILLTALS